MKRLKYRYLQTFRDKGNMFWGIVYPMILASFFFMAFGHLGTESWTEIPVAYVAAGEETVFDSFMEEMDGNLLAVSKMEAEEARKALAEGKVEGILYAPSEGNNPSLSVGKSGLRETVLSMVLDAYVKNSAMMQDIARTHPEKLPEAMQALQSDASHIREVSLGGKTYDTMLEYFFACFAMLCFFGCFIGQKLGAENAANVTPLAARRSISPERKSLAVLQDLVPQLFDDRVVVIQEARLPARRCRVAPGLFGPGELSLTSAERPEFRQEDLLPDPEVFHLLLIDLFLRHSFGLPFFQP